MLPPILVATRSEPEARVHVGGCCQSNQPPQLQRMQEGVTRASPSAL